MVISDLTFSEKVSDNCKIVGGSFTLVDMNIAVPTQVAVPVAVAVSPFGDADAKAYGYNDSWVSQDS